MYVGKNNITAGPAQRAPLRTGAALAVLAAAFLAGVAHAEDAPVPALPASAPAPEGDATAQAPEVTVTGSRLARNYDAPTPVTSITAKEIQAQAPANLADYVNQLPAVSGSVTPSNSQRSLANGTAGVNTINLRNLGSSRTLILLDGHRSVGSTAAGTVDINTIPQGLVKSIEVVTGGASSVYGSDAVAGVVNFILDRDYKGIKADLSYGETTYGDDRTKRVSVTAGTDFADGRGHLLFSGEVLQRDGIYGTGSRAWAANGMHMTLNPAYAAGNGQPEYLPSKQSGLNTTTGGGIITSGPLRGTYFGPGGTINQYNYGPGRVGNSAWTIGGDWQVSQQYDKESLQPEERVKNVFGRASFKLLDNLEIYGEASWNQSHALNWGGYETDKANITIKGDNAYIPAALKAQLNGAGFTLGSFNADIPTRSSDNTRTVQRYVIGLEGNFHLIGTDWKWDGYYQKGVSQAHETIQSAQTIKQGYARDAVFNAAGQIVCRVTRDGSTDPLAAGCIPYNSMGIYGAAQQAALNYFMGTPTRDETYKQDVAALNFHGNIANPFTRPIGLALGVEHRREAISGYADPYSQVNWISGNFLATNGSYTVTEGYVETLVPLPFKFEFNGAARFTSYSASGQVQTWKAGVTWQPIHDLRFRFNRSRDIRAPNLTELFQAGASNTNSLADPWNNRNTVRYTQSVVGNLNLKPEEADSLGVGVSYRPSFLPGFGLSVDYYDIKIKGAIGSVSSQQTVDRCFAGNLDLCSQLKAVLGGPGGTVVPFGSAGFTQAGGPGPNVFSYLVNIVPFNFLQDRSRGIDFEVNYNFALDRLFKGAPGNVSIRGLATHYLEASESNGIDAPTDTVGENSGSGPPNWTYRATLGYDVNRFSMQLIGRGLSAGVYSNQYIECATNCPATSAIHHTISDNHLPGAFYVDTYFAYDLPINKVGAQVYLRVGNIFNRDPAPVGKGPSDNSNVDTGINQTLYDYLGRTFRVGVRVNLGG